MTHLCSCALSSSSCSQVGMRLSQLRLQLLCMLLPLQHGGGLLLQL